MKEIDIRMGDKLHKAFRAFSHSDPRNLTIPATGFILKASTADTRAEVNSDLRSTKSLSTTCSAILLI
jgi:hypothetical protein